MTVVPLLALAGCDSGTIPVSGEVLEVKAAGENEVSVTVEVANDGRARIDVRCEVTIVDENGEKTGLTLVEPGVDPGERRTVTAKGPGPSAARYSLDDASAACSSDP